MIMSFPLNSQTFTIEGLVWDTIYMGINNRINLSNVTCENLKYEISPKINTKKDGCEIEVFPVKPDINYTLSVSDGSGAKHVISLYSQRVTLEIACLANKLLPGQIESLKPEVAKQLRGIQTIVNCPWIRDECKILGYNFRIEKNGDVIYVEDTPGWQLSTGAKSALQNISKGMTIIFDNVKWKTHGDCGGGQTDITLQVE